MRKIRPGGDTDSLVTVEIGVDSISRTQNTQIRKNSIGGVKLVKTLGALLFLFVFISFAASCGGAPAATGAGGAQPTPTPIPIGLFDVQVQTAYENTNTNTLEQDCNIPVGTPVGTSIACLALVPEGRLHFSSVSLVVSAGKSSGCEIIQVSPYYYQASTAVAFTPTWLTAPIDCSGGAAAPKDCYSGPATVLVPGFPSFTGLYFLTAFSASQTFMFPSANISKRLSNRWASNALIVRNAPIVIAGDGYVANSMHDYQFVCNDRWTQPLYTINLTIQDNDDLATGNTNVNNPAFDQWPDWNSALGILFKSL